MLDSINLADVSDVLTWAAGVVAAVLVLIKAFRKIMNKLFDDQMKQIGEEIRAVSEKIEKVDKTLSERMDKVDMDSCKNFLVRCLADIDRGDPITETEKERFYEQYEHYTKNDGNSYIKQKVDRLQQEGKL